MSIISHSEVLNSKDILPWHQILREKDLCIGRQIVLMSKDAHIITNITHTEANRESFYPDKSCVASERNSVNSYMSFLNPLSKLLL